MTTNLDDFVQNAPQRDEYSVVLQKLKPILDNLPPKIVSIDGRAGVGKTTLGRFLAWRFNITLIETDLFLIPHTGKFEYRIDQIRAMIEARICGDRPVIVEGVVALRILQEAEFKSDFHIQVVCDQSEGNSATEAEWSKYENEFRSAGRADLILDLPVV